MKRAIRLAALGSLGTSILLILLTPDPGDPLRLTVALLPLLVAGFAALHGAAGEGRRPLSGLRLGVLGAVAGWGVVAVGWRHLALPRAEPVVAAAGVLLLAGWLAQELPGLLRSLVRSPGALPSRVFFLLPLLAYLAVLPWIQPRHLPNGDEPYYLLVAHSIVYDGDIDLANNYARDDALAFMPGPIESQTGDPQGDRGQIYSRHSPAVPLLLALPYRLGGRTGAVLVMLLLAAGVAWGGLALARELHPRRHRGQLLAWLALAFGSPLAMYSYRFWGEVPAALGLTLASVLILRRRDERPPSPGWFFMTALLLAYPVLIKSRFALVSLPLGVLAWWRAGRRWKPAVVVGASLLVAGAAMLILNLAHFDQILGTYTLEVLDLRRYPVGNWLRSAAGFLLDGAFGLAAGYPLWLLLLPGLALTVTRRPASRWLLLAWMPYFLVLLPRGNAFSQFAPPFRYALAVLPLLAACLVPALADRRDSVRTVTRALAGLTLVLAIVWIVQPEWTVNRVTGSNHLIDRLALLTHSDLGRLFPSYMRVRTAAWAWIAAVLLLAACWRWWPARPRLRGLATPLLLVVAASAVWAASHSPTRTVEPEDLWLEHQGGKPYPAPWKPWAQPRAWRLAPGDGIRVPTIPGGPIMRPRVRLKRLGDTRRQVALELVADDGRVLQHWADELDPELDWQWKTLPPVVLSGARPEGLTFRAVELPRAGPRPVSIRVRRVRPTSPQIRIDLRSAGRTLARWQGHPEPDHGIDVPVGRLRWREGESHPLVLVPAGRSKTGSRGSPVVLRLRFEPPETVHVRLGSGGVRLGAWSGSPPPRGWRRLQVREPSPSRVWWLPARDYGTIVLDRARFEWSTRVTPEGDGAAAARPAAPGSP